MDDGVGMEQVVECVQVAAVTCRQPLERDGLANLRHAGVSRATASSARLPTSHPASKQFADTALTRRESGVMGGRVRRLSFRSRSTAVAVTCVVVLLGADVVA